MSRQTGVAKPVYHHGFVGGAINDASHDLRRSIVDSPCLSVCPCFEKNTITSLQRRYLVHILPITMYPLMTPLIIVSKGKGQILEFRVLFVSSKEHRYLLTSNDDSVILFSAAMNLMLKSVEKMSRGPWMRAGVRQPLPGSLWTT